MRLTDTIAIDTETTGLSPWHGDRPFAVSMCNEEGETLYEEWVVDPFSRDVYPGLTYGLQTNRFPLIKSILENPKIAKVYHNAKFDYRMLRSVGIIHRGPMHDMLLAARICNTSELQFGLKYLAKKYLHLPDDDESDLKSSVRNARVDAKHLGWKIHEDIAADYWMPKCYDPDNSICEQYAIWDAVRTMGLFKLYSQAMEKDPHYAQTYRMEMALFWKVLQMEDRGVAIDRSIVLEEYQKAIDRIDKHTQSMRLIAATVPIYQQWDKPLNPASPKQLNKLIYTPLHEGGFGLKKPELSAVVSVKDKAVGAKRATGTNWRALAVNADHPFVRELLSFRSAHKAAHGFFEVYRDIMVPDADPIPEGWKDDPNRWKGGWVVHPWFSQAGAKTGRFSCQDPNLQQAASAELSFRSWEPINSRGPFIPRPGYNFYCFDYSGQEVRIFADVANDKKMIYAFERDIDIHDNNANEAWGGRDNPSAIVAACYAMELGTQQVSSPKILETWAKYGWNYDKAAHGIHSPEAQDVAIRWLNDYDWNITKAEASSLGKKSVRGRAKMLIFAKVYGGGSDAVKNLLYCSLDEARQYLKQFDTAFPRVKQFMLELTNQTAQTGYVITRYGRKLRLDPGFEYRCVNYLVQGTAADMMKDGMLRVAEYLEDTGLDAHMVMTVHDEIVFEIRKEHAYRWLLRGIRDIMQDTGIDPQTGQPRLRIPMVVDCAIARKNWEEKRLIPQCPNDEVGFSHDAAPSPLNPKMYECQTCGKQWERK